MTVERAGGVVGSVAAPAWARALLRRSRPYLPALAGSVLVGAVSVRAILARAGHPAAPLDDTFIHLQYARRLAEGAFFEYVPGYGYTTGATSFLWPVLLAIPHALGLSDLSLLWAAWLFGTLAHAALAVEVARLARPLAGRTAAIGAGAMCIVFGAFAWFAWSGMETIPFSWALTRALRLSTDRLEPGDDRARPGNASLAAMGIVAPLFRPEGAIASLACAVALALRPSKSGLCSRAFCLVPLAGPLVVPALHLGLAGHAASSTTTVKWLVGNPYYQGAALFAAVGAHLRLLWTSVLDGGDWTALFLPEGFRIPLALGAIALVPCAMRQRRPWRAALVAVLAFSTVATCTYLSFLWNRVRYVWPFAGAWFVLLACLSRAAGRLVRVALPKTPDITALVAGCFAGALATKLPWAVRDLAQSAHAIDRQRVALGRWVRENLPAHAKVGVNDTGAIAYLGGRATFDVVGLTTEGEARHWVAGPGSRFEHYERLPRERLPTHFVVYPHWMACPPVLGRVLTEATVVDQSILGGATMVAYEARWDLLGSGARPAAPEWAGATILDELDVADLESEREHDYALDGAMDGENHAELDAPPGDEEAPPIADGGRSNRWRDRFVLSVPSGRARLVMRVAAELDVRLEVRIAGGPPIPASIPAGRWTELAVPLEGPNAGRTPLEIAAADGGRFTSYHYWLLAP